MVLMFERLIFGGAHIEVLIKAWLILKVGLMDAQYWWAPRAQWLNKAQARAPVPSCTIYNRSAFFQLHHNNAAWWRSEWFGDSTIGLLNFFAKKNVWKQDQIDQTLNFKTMSVTKNLYWFTLWLQQKYHFLTKTRSYFSISILLSKTFGHVVNLLLYQSCCREVNQFEIDILIISNVIVDYLGNKLDSGFHWFKRGWLITHHDGKDASIALNCYCNAIEFNLNGQLTCDVSRYYLGK